MKHNYLEKVIHGIFVFLIMVCLAIPVNVYADTDVCAVCGGLGECPSCFGLGECSSCSGEKYRECSRCFNGRCRNCGGLGTIKSYTVYGSKERTCSSCYGSGNCSSCYGLGKKACFMCNGSGKCQICGGSRVCSACHGRGTSYSGGKYKTDSQNNQNKEESVFSKDQKEQEDSQVINLDCTDLKMKVGESYTFHVTGRTKDGTVSDSYDKKFIAVDSDSDFTYKALKAGKTTIEFSSTDGAVKAVCNITIEDNEEDTDNSYKVSVSKGYLAFRKEPKYGEGNEKGELYTGDKVLVEDRSNSQYWYVYAFKYQDYGYVDKDYLIRSADSSDDDTPVYKTVKVDKGYLAFRKTKSFGEANEKGELYTGDVVEVRDTSDSTYWLVYSSKYDDTGYVNKDYLY